MKFIIYTFTWRQSYLLYKRNASSFTKLNEEVHLFKQFFFYKAQWGSPFIQAERTYTFSVTPSFRFAIQFWSSSSNLKEDRDTYLQSNFSKIMGSGDPIQA